MHTKRIVSLVFVGLTCSVACSFASDSSFEPFRMSLRKWEVEICDKVGNEALWKSEQPELFQIALIDRFHFLFEKHLTPNILGAERSLQAERELLARLQRSKSGKIKVLIIRYLSWCSSDASCPSLWNLSGEEQETVVRGVALVGLINIAVRGDKVGKDAFRHYAEKIMDLLAQPDTELDFRWAGWSQHTGRFGLSCQKLGRYKTLSANERVTILERFLSLLRCEDIVQKESHQRALLSFAKSFGFKEFDSVFIKHALEMPRCDEKLVLNILRSVKDWSVRGSFVFLRQQMLNANVQVAQEAEKAYRAAIAKSMSGGSVREHLVVLRLSMLSVAHGSARTRIIQALNRDKTCALEALREGKTVSLTSREIEALQETGLDKEIVELIRKRGAKE